MTNSQGARAMTSDHHQRAAPVKAASTCKGTTTLSQHIIVVEWNLFVRRGGLQPLGQGSFVVFDHFFKSVKKQTLIYFVLTVVPYNNPEHKDNKVMIVRLGANHRRKKNVNVVFGWDLG